MKDLKGIKLIILDCDGVLTDGKIVYTAEKDADQAVITETKSFSAQDGLILGMLKLTDLKVAVVTGRSSDVLLQRCKDVGIDILYQGVKNKLKVVEELLEQQGLTWENVAYMGDDWNDFPVIDKAYFTFAPAQSLPTFKTRVDKVTYSKGGDGAVREAVEYILMGQNKFDTILEKYMEYLKE